MHHLVDDIIYGPVESRRYGRTFGINPIPGAQKICSFNCVYCQLGWTPHEEADLSAFAAPADVAEAIAQAAGRPGAKDIDAFVCCGNGEPSMHPEFPAFVDAMITARDAHFPGKPIMLLTNASGLTTPENLAAAARVEECAIKLDAGSYKTLRRVNLPRSRYDLVEVVNAIADLSNSAVQACFFAGRPTNTGDEDVEAWLGALRHARPRRIDIYTIARTPPASSVLPAERAVLESIAQKAHATTGAPVRIFPGDD